MILFDLDGCLANCEHRRHLVDPNSVNHLQDEKGYYNVFTRERFKPDWQSFYDACDKDEPIIETRELFHDLHTCEKEVHIWSGRCESVKEKTIEWLMKHFSLMYCCAFNYDKNLKMRPIGDSTPDDELKEKWLEETYEDTKWGRRSPIQFVFESDPKSIAMWHSHSVFVFDCNQDGKEF